MEIEEVKKIAETKGSDFFAKNTLNFVGVDIDPFRAEIIDGQVYIYRIFWHSPETDDPYSKKISPKYRQGAWKFIEMEDSVEFHPIKIDDIIFRQLYKIYN